MNYKLSPSALNLFLDCPRCFWLEKLKGIKRPRGIFPSLPGGMDRVIKTHFDLFRAKDTLPPELSGTNFEGIKLFSDQVRLDRWRSWRTGLEYREAGGLVLSGALDDLLVKGDRYLPFDYKTKGSVTTEEDAVKYYQNQLDCYSLLLEANGMPTEGHGFLLYFSPKLVREMGNVLFEVQLIRIGTVPENAKATFRRAIELLGRPMPEPSPACEYCDWLSRMKMHV